MVLHAETNMGSHVTLKHGIIKLHYSAMHAAYDNEASFEASLSVDV